MIVWAASGIVYGLAFIISPGQTLARFGPEKWPAYAAYFLMLPGNVYIVTCVLGIRAECLIHSLLAAISNVMQDFVWCYNIKRFPTSQIRRITFP